MLRLFVALTTGQRRLHLRSESECLMALVAKQAYLGTNAGRASSAGLYF